MAVTKSDVPGDQPDEKPGIGPGLFEDDLRPNVGEPADPDTKVVVGKGGKTLLEEGKAVEVTEDEELEARREAMFDGAVEVEDADDAVVDDEKA